MKNLNSIFKLMVKVSLPLLVFLGFALWAPGINNSAIAVNCCMHDYYIFTDWVYNAQTVDCCETGVCYIKTRHITAILKCDNVPCDEPYYDDECWYPCCDDAPVIQQTVGCTASDEVTYTFYEHQVYDTCALNCFCHHGNPCTSWFEPIDPKDCAEL